jgi:hypothetical protein
MALEKKLSPGTKALLSQLNKSVAEHLGEDGEMVGDLEISWDKPKLEDALINYTTTTDLGERGVSFDDIQAVNNFRRDEQNAVRVFTGDTGAEHMEKNPNADSFRVTLNNPSVGISVQAAFYRPGREEQGNTNFVSITDEWEGNDEDKAIEEHLKSLTKGLVKKG